MEFIKPNKGFKSLHLPDCNQTINMLFMTKSILIWLQSADVLEVSASTERETLVD